MAEAFSIGYICRDCNHRYAQISGGFVMPGRTHFVTTVTLCDAAGHMTWTSSPNPAYKPGPFVWEYASPEDREQCKNAISRAVVLREPQEFDASTHLGERYHVWIWPLHSPELAICMLAVQVPAEMRLLSARERTSLERLAEGRTTSEIARAMGVSVSTVHTHFRRARKKLKLRSVEGLIGFAARYCYPATAPLADWSDDSASDANRNRPGSQGLRGGKPSRK